MIIGIDASRANKPYKSGTEWYSYYLIRWLAKLDSKNQYILYTDKPLKGGLLDLSTKQYMHIVDEAGDQEVKYDKDGFQILNSYHNNFKAKVLKWPYRFFWTQGRLSLEMIFSKPDILFIPAHTLPLIHPKNSVVTVHDIGFIRESRLYSKERLGPENRRGGKILNFLIKIFTRGKYGTNSVDYLKWSTLFTLKKAKKIITVSQFSKDEIIEVYGGELGVEKLKEKIEVVYNGFNKYLYHAQADEAAVKNILSKYGISGPYLFYIGRLEIKKNTPNLIEAFAKMRSANKDIQHKLVLAGTAGFGYDEVNYRIREYGLDNDIIITGWLEELDLPHLYHGADALIFPSFYEGFGIPLLQAMACELPIAASRAASIPEVVDGAALLFDPTNINEMSEAMKRIIVDKQLKRELVAKGAQKVAEFSWENTARKTLEILSR